MKKYVLTIDITVLAESNEDAIQKGFNIARNERKKFDNNCKLSQVTLIEGLTEKEIKFNKE